MRRIMYNILKKEHASQMITYIIKILIHQNLEIGIHVKLMKNYVHNHLYNRLFRYSPAQKKNRFL